MWQGEQIRSEPGECILLANLVLLMFVSLLLDDSFFAGAFGPPVEVVDGRLHEGVESFEVLGPGDWRLRDHVFYALGHVDRVEHHEGQVARPDLVAQLLVDVLVDRLQFLLEGCVI